MKKYIQESFDKFKKDALSKVIYDILKVLIPLTIAMGLTYLVPKGTGFTDIISTNVTLSIYWIVIISLILIIFTILVMNYIFKRKYKELQKDNFTDELTGLKNHKALKQYLTDNLTELQGNYKPMSLVIIDIDDFKNFNTKVGYNTADKILKKVGELLGNDKRITDETFRQFLRGDEFLVIANETNLGDAFKAAERKRKLIEKTLFKVDGQSYSLTVSCGVTEYKKGEDNFTSLTDRVNTALIDAKAQKGKNCTRTNF